MAGQTRPSQNEENEQSRLDETAPQIVENLPARDHRKMIRHQTSRFLRNLGQQPAGNLPIAAHPAMLALVVRAVMRGIIFDHLNIANQPSPRVSALHEVMTQQRVPRKAPVEHTMQCFYFVNSFTNKNSFTVKVLINVRSRVSVDIESGLSRINAGQPRARGTLHADPDPRLQNAITGHHNTFVRINDGLI